MSKYNISFSDFLKNEEETYFTAMNKLGINKDDYKKFPQSSSFFSFGQVPFNLGIYTILDFKRNEKGDITHAKVKQIRDKHFNSLSYDKEDREKLDKSNEEESFLVPIEDLESLMTQANQQPAAPPEGGIV